MDISKKDKNKQEDWKEILYFDHHMKTAYFEWIYENLIRRKPMEFDRENHENVCIK